MKTYMVFLFLTALATALPHALQPVGVLHTERECIKNYDQHFQQEEKAVEARDMSPRNAENNKVSCASYSRRFPLPLSLPLSLSNANLSIRIYSLTVTTIGVVTNG